jgi:hypothetical protein
MAEEKYPLNPNLEYVLPVRCGGLANQWFQIMAGEIYAMINNKICVITKETQNSHNTHHQEYAETVFRRTKFVDDIPFKKFTFFPQVVGFEEWEPWHIPGNVILRGYFQYYPLLEKHKEFVLNYFLEGFHQFLVPPTMKVGLHIRRQDYIGNRDHPLCSEKYYRKSLNIFTDEIQEYGISIFSDDISWCKNQDFLKNIQNVEFIDESNELKVMGLMVSRQGGFICSNSTYAWLGAWAGTHQAGNIITVPRKWYIPKDASNLIPREWIIVEE